MLLTWLFGTGRLKLLQTSTFVLSVLFWYGCAVFSWVRRGSVACFHKMGCNQSTEVPQPRRVGPGADTIGENSDVVRVRMPAPWKADGPVTQAKLDLDRTTFWETNPKVQGNPRVWEALRVACEALLAGDVELCNTILEAGDIRVPHGTLSMSYDARGFLYELPQYCYSSPTNILSAEEASLPKRTGHVGTVEDIPITLRVSASPKTTEQDVLMHVKTNERVSAVKQRLHSELMEARGRHDNHTSTADTPATWRRGEGNKWRGIGLPPTLQRLYCQGRLLPDDCMMQECGVKPHMIVQVFVKPVGR